MSIRFNSSKPGATRGLLLCGLVAVGLAEGTMTARPIEFSEPGSTNLTVNVSGLGVKPAALPDVSEQVFRPHQYPTKQSLSSGIKPLARPALAARPNNRAPGVFDQDKTWMQQTPQEMLQGMMERDALKLPTFSKPSESTSSRDPFTFTPTRRNAATKTETSGMTNRWNGTGALNANDPYAVLSGRRPAPDYPATLDVNAARPRGVEDWLHVGDDPSREGRRDRLDNFNLPTESRRTPGWVAPNGNADWRNPAALPNRNPSLVNDLEKSARTPGVAGGVLLPRPAVPVAPIAPLAPTSTSLTPKPYVPPTKPKPLNVSAPRRPF
jgi:hypothetical protein